MSKGRRCNPKRSRLHRDVVERLRHSGGPHGSKKGAKGYNRRRDKRDQEKKRR